MLIESENDYYFTDGHATDNLTSFYDKSKINELFSIIDWQAVKAPFWGGHDNLNIKRKKQAEFLYSKDIEPTKIAGLGCYNEKAQEALIELGVQKDLIKIVPKAYF